MINKCFSIASLFRAVSAMELRSLHSKRRQSLILQTVYQIQIPDKRNQSQSHFLRWIKIISVTPAEFTAVLTAPSLYAAIAKLILERWVDADKLVSSFQFSNQSYHSLPLCTASHDEIRLLDNIYQWCHYWRLCCRSSFMFCFGTRQLCVSLLLLLSSPVFVFTKSVCPFFQSFGVMIALVSYQKLLLSVIEDA